MQARVRTEAAKAHKGGLLRMGDSAAKSGSDEQETHDSSTAPLIFFFSSSTSAFSSSRLDCPPTSTLISNYPVLMTRNRKHSILQHNAYCIANSPLCKYNIFHVHSCRRIHLALPRSAKHSVQGSIQASNNQ